MSAVREPEHLAVRCAVVVVAHNGVGVIGPCLRSLLAAGTEPDDIVVVDNASHDGTVDLVHQIDEAITVVESRVNVGYGHGANLGIAATAHPFVAVLNQDVTVTSNWLRSLVAALEDDPCAGLATPKILLSNDPTRLNACGNLPHYTGITSCRAFGRSADAYTSSQIVGAVSGAAFVVRREVFDEIGGFDPLFFMYLEENDLSLRAALAGHTTLFVAGSVVMHDFVPRFSAEKIHWLERNRFLLLAKLFSWRTLLVLAPAIAATELLVLAYSATRGPSVVLAKLSAYAWAARQMPSIAAARRGTQRLRRVSDRQMLATLSDELDLSELGHPAAHSVETVANVFFRGWASVARRLVTW
jgi:GT2 family glycosyltransferase